MIGKCCEMNYLCAETGRVSRDLREVLCVSGPVWSLKENVGKR